MRAHLVTLLLSCALAGLIPAPGASASGPRHIRALSAPLFPQAALEPTSFGALDGWDADDPRPALKAFRQSCRALGRGQSAERPSRAMFDALRQVCASAAHLPRHPSERQARTFFERHFRPFLISGIGEQHGFLTGYYEPEVDGSRSRSDVYATPLYARPKDLVLRAPPKNGPPANKGEAFRREGDALVPYYDRAAIEDGALKEKGLEIAWIRDPADAFFAHIQGSLRVRLPDGGVLRLNYDGHNGQSYTPIGRLLVERGLVPREKMSMDAIRAYIAEHPQEGRELMRQNRSYIFFREAKELRGDDGAVGAQGLPLTAGRSIAVDRTLHLYGTPFYLDAELPTGREGADEPFHRLMIAQDTGSAIIGPARADIFFGAGDEAGSIAGRIRHPGRFAILLPKALDFTRVRAPLPPARPDIPGAE